MKLAFFGLQTRDGMDLARRAGSLARAMDYAVNEVDPAEVTQRNLFIAGLTYDVVVFDGTIENDHVHNYHAAIFNPKLVDHLLIVSRSYLPINHEGARTGGSPDYPFPHFDPRIDSTNRAWSNDDILEWLEAQLLDSRARGPRPKRVHFENLDFSNIDSVGRMVTAFYADSAPRPDVTDRVFLSYHGRSWNEVNTLKTRLESGDLHQGRPQTVDVAPPGAVAYQGELLSVVRRWQSLALIDSRIAACAEFVAYRSDDYLASWWTQGELATVAYRRSTGSQSAPTVRVFDSRHPAVLREAGVELTPILSTAEGRRMARWYLHTDPATIAPENVRYLRTAHKAMKNAPELLDNLAMKVVSLHPSVRQIFAAAQEQMGDQLGTPDVEKVKDLAQDEMWSDESWENVLFECPNAGHNSETSIDLSRFISAQPSRLIPIRPDQMRITVGTGAIYCPACKNQHAVVEAPPRYLWQPLRVIRGEVKTRERTGLTRLETHVLLD